MNQAKAVHVAVRIKVADFFLWDSGASILLMRCRATAESIAQIPLPIPIVAAAHNADVVALAPAASKPDAITHL
jgi:hypothetical protein